MNDLERAQWSLKQARIKVEGAEMQLAKAMKPNNLLEDVKRYGDFEVKSAGTWHPYKRKQAYLYHWGSDHQQRECFTAVRDALDKYNCVIASDETGDFTIFSNEQEVRSNA